MKIAICDDNIQLAKKLQNFIKDYFAYHAFHLSEIKLYNDGVDLINAIQHETDFDIIFMDIEMPNLSGIETAKIIRQEGSDALLIFATAHPNFMIQSFKVEAFDFLTKPISYPDIVAVLNRCHKKLQRQYGQLRIKTAFDFTTISLHQVLYFSSTKHYLNIFLTNGKQLKTLSTLTQMENKLTAYPQFARCHQSYLVNLDYVNEIQVDKITIRQEYSHLVNTLPISRKYKNKFREQYFYLFD